MCNQCDSPDVVPGRKICRACKCKYQNKWYHKNKVKVSTRWHNKTPLQKNHIYITRKAAMSKQPWLDIEYSQKWRMKVKLEVLGHYGGKCAECGITDIDMLTVDHLHNNGKQHREAINISGGVHFYNYLKKQGYPPEFQILCFNHNFKKEIVRKRTLTNDNIKHLKEV